MTIVCVTPSKLYQWSLEWTFRNSFTSWKTVESGVKSCKLAIILSCFFQSNQVNYPTEQIKFGYRFLRSNACFQPAESSCSHRFGMYATKRRLRTSLWMTESQSDGFSAQVNSRFGVFEKQYFCGSQFYPVQTLSRYLHDFIQSGVFHLRNPPL